jgi:multidrug resistance protein, MATE family
VTAAMNGFFAGRGRSWTVLLINAVGTTTNAVLAVPLILWQKDDPVAAIAGAGYAAALGSTVSALFGLFLFFRPRYRAEFQTLAGWRFDPKLFLRLMRFGLPNGVQWCIEGLSFTLFILLVGNLGPRELAATTLTFSLNMLTFLPVMGLGQGVEVLVGRRQGEERPDLSAKSTWTAVKLATAYNFLIAFLYVTIPDKMVWLFASETDPVEWAAIAPMIPLLLQFVAAYTLADGINIILSYALRGAGDTRFVVLVAIGLSWPLMVIPTWIATEYGWGIKAAWAAATLYIAATAGVYILRFLGGRWRTMKVIETPVAVEPPAPTPSANGDASHR